MKLRELIAKKTADRDQILAKRNEKANELNELRGKDDLTEADQERIAVLREEKASLDADLDQRADDIRELTEEAERDESLDREAASSSTPGADRPAYDRVVRVGAEERTYRPDQDRNGAQFLADVARSAMGVDRTASQRLDRHMAEEAVERAGQQVRGVAGTGAFAGLTVPQYLIDQTAKNAKAGRPFADVCRHLDLPSTGMTVNLSRVTTGTTPAKQATQGTGETESSLDDTLLTEDVLTVENWQSVSRQAAERSVTALDVTIDDLVRGYHTKLDSMLINEATIGLTNVAQANTYTTTTPTVAEVYSKIIQAATAQEEVLLDQGVTGAFALMSPRRWGWFQSPVTDKHPFIGQPNIDAIHAGENFAELYGRAPRGFLPNGMPVIVDANVPKTLGDATNQDEIYIVNANEAYLWEDPNAPMFIRADQAGATDLKIPLVVYGWFAFTFRRYTNGMQKVSGTGLTTPVFG